MLQQEEKEQYKAFRILRELFQKERRSARREGTAVTATGRSQKGADSRFDLSVPSGNRSPLRVRSSFGRSPTQPFIVPELQKYRHLVGVGARIK